MEYGSVDFVELRYPSEIGYTRSECPLVNVG